MDLHAQALHLSRQHKRIENELIFVLQRIDRVKLYKTRGHSSLFLYAVKELELSEAFAYSVISVARKAVKLPLLQENLFARKISLHKASRIVSALDEKNAEELIEFASAHSSREIDREVARLKPGSIQVDRARFVNEDAVKIEMTVSLATFEKWQRVRDLVASKKSRGRKEGMAGAALQEVSLKNAGSREALAESFGLTQDALIENYLDRHDPVRKAGRSFGRKSRHIQSAKRVDRLKAAENVSSLESTAKSEHDLKIEGQTMKPEFCARRKPLRAWQKHSVIHRDGGRCTFVDGRGQRCHNERWLHLHHVRHVAAGGNNSPENLRTLCWYHHDLVHQLSFPIGSRAEIETAVPS